MKLITANIGRGIGHAQVRSDMQKIKNEAPRAIIGWQEIDEADEAQEHSILRSIFGRQHLIGMEHRVPISVPRWFRVTRSRSVFATGGIPHVSPTRWFTEAVIQNRRGNKKFVVINGHYPAGAFNNKIESTQKERKDHWEEMFQVHKARVAHWVDQGYTVFWVGDVNRMDMPKVHHREVRVVTTGIDSISYVIGASHGHVKPIGVKFRGAGSIKLNSDHDAKWARFKLTPPRR